VDKLAALLKKAADWTLRGIIGVFALLLGLQKISAPIINNLAIQTARNAVGAVPLVGGALNAAVDTVLHWGQAARSAVLVALVLVICVTLAVPLIKMLALMLVYRIVAAVVQPVSDSRFVQCLDSVGAYMGSMAAAGCMVGIMCVYAVVILLSF
jgi:stage III sporulation protein AE